jgi:hypothetical protein
LDLQAAGSVITDLLDMAHDEGFIDLYSACLEYRRRIHPGCLANYAQLLSDAGDRPAPGTIAPAGPPASASKPQAVDPRPTDREVTPHGDPP